MVWRSNDDYWQSLDQRAAAIVDDAKEGDKGVYNVEGNIRGRQCLTWADIIQGRIPFLVLSDEIQLAREFARLGIIYATKALEMKDSLIWGYKRLDKRLARNITKCYISEFRWILTGEEDLIVLREAYEDMLLSAESLNRGRKTLLLENHYRQIIDIGLRIGEFTQPYDCAEKLTKIVTNKQCKIIDNFYSFLVVILKYLTDKEPRNDRLLNDIRDNYKTFYEKVEEDILGMSKAYGGFNGLIRIAYVYYKYFNPGGKGPLDPVSVIQSLRYGRGGKRGQAKRRDKPA